MRVNQAYRDKIAEYVVKCGKVDQVNNSFVVSVPSHTSSPKTTITQAKDDLIDKLYTFVHSTTK